MKSISHNNLGKRFMKAQLMSSFHTAFPDGFIKSFTTKCLQLHWLCQK